MITKRFMYNIIFTDSIIHSKKENGFHMDLTYNDIMMLIKKEIVEFEKVVGVNPQNHHKKIGVKISERAYYIIKRTDPVNRAMVISTPDLQEPAYVFGLPMDVELFTPNQVSICLYEIEKERKERE